LPRRNYAEQTDRPERQLLFMDGSTIRRSPDEGSTSTRGIKVDRRGWSGCGTTAQPLNNGLDSLLRHGCLVGLDGNKSLLSHHIHSFHVGHRKALHHPLITLDVRPPQHEDAVSQWAVPAGNF
jgi:hypothetical protein